jgi:hypothetical protein
MEAKEKQKNWWKTQRRLNWMSWNSNHRVGWTDTINSSFIGWVQRPKDSKQTVGWIEGIGNDSSDALRFGNSKGQGSASSAPDDPTPWPAVYPTLAFKSYRDTPRFLLQHRMNRCLRNNPAVHPTPTFKLHSSAHTGALQHRWSDGASVHSVSALTGSLGSTAILDPVSDRMIRRLRRGNHRFIRRYYFFRKPFPMASLPC